MGAIHELARFFVTAPNYDIPFNSPDGDVEGVLLPNGLYGQRMRALRAFPDIYIGQTDGKITDLIRCSQKGDVPWPSCGHILTAGDYDMKITYPLGALDQWREYRTRAADLVWCFTTKNPTRKGG